MYMDPSQIVLAVGRKSVAGINLLGTAFAVGTNKFATAAHVTGQDDSGLVLVMPTLSKITDYQDTTSSSISCGDVKLAAYDPVRDISILKGDFSVSFPYQVGGSDEAPPGTRIVSIGFPHCPYGRLVLTQQSSTVGARVLLAAGPLKPKHLVLNVLMRPGQSGSPVFIENQPRVCEMVTGSYIPPGAGGISLGGIDPQTLHQTTHAISTEYIGAML
jgi:hypothetical protein